MMLSFRTNFGVAHFRGVFMNDKQDKKLSESEKYHQTNVPRIVPEDILAERIQAPNWDTEDPRDALTNIYNSLLDKSMEMQHWYMNKKKSKKRYSVMLRVSAISAGLIGTIYPTLIMTKLPFFQKNQTLGYLSLGIAATCVAADKFLCQSSCWRRYVSTGLMLEKIHYRFQLDWEQLRGKNRDNFSDQTDIENAFNMFISFSEHMHEIVNEETTEFFLDFDNSRVLLESRISSREFEAKTKS